MAARLLGTLSVALVILLGVYGFVILKPFIHLEDVAATDVFLFHQLLWLGSKYVPEALSYAYYLEINAGFPINQYRQPQEVWSVPTWFSYPTGGTTAECNGLGCVVWNLSGGANQNDPCPSVSGPVAPLPDSGVTTVNPTSLRDTFSNVLAQVANLILNSGSTPLSALGVQLSVSYSNTDVQTIGTSEYNGSAELNVELNDLLPLSYTLSLSRSLKNWAILKTDLREYNTIARCICRNSATGNPETVAEYNVAVYYIEVNVDSGDLGRRFVEGNIVYLKYFTARISNNPTPGATYSDCNMVIG